MLEKYSSLSHYLSSYITPSFPRHVNKLTGAPDQGGQRYPTRIIFALLIAGLLWSLSNLPVLGTAAATSYTPESELLLSGSLVGLVPVNATCEGTDITISDTVDAYGGTTLPMKLSLTTASAMTDAYYTLGWPQANLELSLFDTNGQTVRTFQGQEGIFDIHSNTVSISALLVDTNGALLNLSGQVVCQ
ncbi:MAG: hypothetical protein AAF267_08985 [Deinococcota bacterium]